MYVKCICYGPWDLCNVKANMGRVNCLKDFFVIVGFSFHILGSERKVLIGQ